MLFVRYLVLLTLFSLSQAFSSQPAAVSQADSIGASQSDIAMALS